MVPNTQTQANPNSMWSAFLDHSFLVCCSSRLALIPTRRFVAVSKWKKGVPLLVMTLRAQYRFCTTAWQQDQ